MLLPEPRTHQLTLLLFAFGTENVLTAITAFNSKMAAVTFGGACAALVPSFLWIFLGGPYIESLIGITSLSAMLSGITAAVVGAILNLAVWFSLHTLFGRVEDVSAFGMILHVLILATINGAAVLLSLVAVLAIFRFKIGMIPTLAVSSALGVLLYFLPPIPVLAV